MDLSLFLLTFAFANSISAENELVAVTSIVRHGARLPFYHNFYPKDPYIFVRQQLSQQKLLIEGMQELYKVGLWLRKKYRHFLSETYEPHQIYVQSVDLDRCLMSMECLLAALYPPSGNEIWNHDIRWQPIPIHTIQKSEDIVLWTSACPNDQHTEIMKFAHAIQEENSVFFSKLREYTGSKIYPENLIYLFNILHEEKRLGLTLPEWTHGVMDTLVPLMKEYFALATTGKAQKRIRSGRLIERVRKQFSNAICKESFGANSNLYKKFMLYGATDITIYDFTNSLDIVDIGLVHFGFSLFIELWRRKDNSYFVHMYFRNSTKLEAKVYETNIRGYSKNLEYKIFENITGVLGVTTKEWLDECNSSKII